MSTYSFGDVTAVISHPDLGQYVLTGEGIGSISWNRTNDTTSHDVAADGVTMVSKIKAKNGTVAINVQQTSDADLWLIKWNNYLEGATADKWALTTITITNPVLKKTVTCTGVSPQKLADESYQQQGQQKTWNMMAKSIEEQAA